MERHTENVEGRVRLLMWDCSCLICHVCHTLGLLYHLLIYVSSTIFLSSNISLALSMTFTSYKVWKKSKIGKLAVAVSSCSHCLDTFDRCDQGRRGKGTASFPSWHLIPYVTGWHRLAATRAWINGESHNAWQMWGRRLCFSCITRSVTDVFRGYGSSAVFLSQSCGTQADTSMFPVQRKSSAKREKRQWVSSSLWAAVVEGPLSLWLTWTASEAGNRAAGYLITSHPHWDLAGERKGQGQSGQSAGSPKRMCAFWIKSWNIAGSLEF